MKAARLALVFACLTPFAAETALAEAKVIVKPTFDTTKPVSVVAVTVDTMPGVFASDLDIQIIHDKVQKRVDALKPGPDVQAPAIKMLVLLTRFSKGAAAARMTLIGLGSVHVEGKVLLTDADGKPAGEFLITKGLVLGGIAGGLMTANGVEDRFANAVAATVIPKTEVSKPAKPAKGK